MPKVYVLGAGVDATEGIGMPLNYELLPRITEFIKTPEGAEIDEALRNIYPGLRFHFDTFIEKAIDNMARNFNDEVQTIRTRVREELLVNQTLTDAQRNMATLIERLMSKVSNMATGAEIDEDTANLIRTVFGADAPVHDESIIDLDKIVFTGTFQSVVRMLLVKSLEQPGDPVLRHMNRNFLDIEKLLVQYFVGFFINKANDIKSYSYISWMLWAYLLTCEQKVIREKQEQEGSLSQLAVYSQIEAGSTIVNFNYTTFAQQFASLQQNTDVLYFHGSILNYLDIKRKQDFDIDLSLLHTLDIKDFFNNDLRPNVSFESGLERLTIPSFMPPVAIKPVLSQKNIETWYKTFESLRNTNQIVVVGYSFNSFDDHFNGMLRQCRTKPITIVDQNVEPIMRTIQSLYNIHPEDYAQRRCQGFESFERDGVKIIKAKAHEIDYTQL